ncbi:MAG: hypothetical protein IJH77_01695 [Mogibacterium sp.]|nr:hypothetical protein [Mogibacterium sp.]
MDTGKGSAKKQYGKIILIAVLLIAVIIAVVTIAQTAPKNKVAKAAVEGYLQSYQSNNYDEAAEYSDLVEMNLMDQIFQHDIYGVLGQLCDKYGFKEQDPEGAAADALEEVQQTAYAKFLQSYKITGVKAGEDDQSRLVNVKLTIGFDPEVFYNAGFAADMPASYPSYDALAKDFAARCSTALESSQPVEDVVAHFYVGLMDDGSWKVYNVFVDGYEAEYAPGTTEPEGLLDEGDGEAEGEIELNTDEDESDIMSEEEYKEKMEGDSGDLTEDEINDLINAEEYYNKPDTSQ